MLHDEDIDDAFAGLPSEAREILTLRFVCGLEVEAIAARVHQPKTVVRQRLHFARLCLQRDVLRRQQARRARSHTVYTAVVNTLNQPSAPSSKWAAVAQWASSFTMLIFRPVPRHGSALTSRAHVGKNGSRTTTTIALVP